MHGWYLFNGFYGLPFFLHYCPVKLTRFLPSVEMTGHPWVFMEDGVVIPNETKWSEGSHVTTGSLF